MKTEHVPGQKKCKIMLYALSTCQWCRKTKEHLSSLGVEYDFVHVDLLPSKEQEEAEKQVAKWNPERSFPTIVFDDKDCIVGFRPEEINKRVGK
jgi:glutaredoxin-like protein NrdH